MNSPDIPTVGITGFESTERTSRITSALLWATFVASLGGLLFGFDTVVISGCQQQLKALFQLTGFQQGFMTASALVGAVIGSLVAAKPGDFYGRRDSMKVAGAFYLLCALGCAFAWNLWVLVGFRLLGGIAVGATSVLGPMYLAEISPAAWRGRLVAFFQFNIVLGCLLALLSNYLIGLLNLGAPEWRWKLGIQALPALAFFVMLFSIVRSPRWLVMKGLKSEAFGVLQKIGTLRAEAQMAAIEESLRHEQSARSAPLFVRSLARPIFLAWAVAMFNQLDGINALWYYLNPIFTMAGFNKVSGDLQSVILGVANLIATMAGMAIIDKAGRKPLLLWGAIGTGVCMGLVAWVFNGTEHHGWLVWLLVGFVICHAFGQGAVIWVYISEIFPNAVRGKGQTLGSFTHWFMAMVISWIFPVVARDAGQPHAGLPFAFFAVMMIVQVVVVWVYFPETKRVSLEDMQRRLRVLEFFFVKGCMALQHFNARIVRGHRVASGLNGNPHFPGGTLRMQAPHFKALGFDIGGLYPGTLNASIAPFSYRVIRPAYTFAQVKWHLTEPPEDFSFFDVSVSVTNGPQTSGFVYFPHPDTKPAHFQNPDVLELLLPYIPSISYDTLLQLSIPAEQMRIVPPVNSGQETRATKGTKPA